MLFLSALFSPEISHNSAETVQQLLLLKKVKVTDSTINRSLEEHADYPSLLSISDALFRWKVDNVTIRASVDQLRVLPLPYVVKLQHEQSSFFTVVKEWSNGKVLINDAVSKKWQWMDETIFLERWKGFVMLAEQDAQSGEQEYVKQKKRADQKKLTFLSTLIVVLGLWLVPVILNIATYSWMAWPVVAAMTLKFFGSYIGSLLLWYEVDKSNAGLQKVCKAGKKINCQAILNSNAAKVIGRFSWSEIGFFYFIGGFISLLVTGMDNNILTALAWLNVLALPYTLFSVYYQWRIARQWCSLCLTVQGILVAEFIVNLFGHQLALPFWSIAGAMTLLAAFVLPALIWFIIKPIFIAAKDSRSHELEVLRMKRNPQLFQSLLQKQRVIESDTTGLGISLGNPNGSIKITKVCNPYCGPCAKSHVHIDELLDGNPEVQVQIIFTMKGDINDMNNVPVKHLMAIHQLGDEKLTRQALDAWYNAPVKDYNVFAARFPKHEAVQQQDAMVVRMGEWCRETNIAFTPTFFLNGRQFPDTYSISDLKYFLS
ncbi:vitamin K epoxide reductase family protein [Chitinophaga sancti]|uniref:vitamin K epoxide reductase family protein n=1 Tax=Chitinophaga sancti TaxID=1004 RepID=UPI002A75628F|nr:vitamin K epoxide reductase family protein [Chitinophaga sancti]WPQ63679.1 vitamin K epoxide reductase family protein [Chitinophaga sancti]